MDAEFVCISENILEGVQREKDTVNKTDVVGTLVLAFPKTSGNVNCDAGSLMHRWHRSSRLREPALRVAGPTAIASLASRKMLHWRGKPALVKRFNDPSQCKTSDIAQDRQKLKEQSGLNRRLLCRAFYYQLQYHEARAALSAERTFPSACSLTGVYSIHRTSPGRNVGRHSTPINSDSAVSLRSSVHSEGWIVWELPKEHSELSFLAAMQRWLGNMQLTERSSLLSPTDTHEHHCAALVDSDVSGPVPRFLACQSHDKIMLVFHTVAADPTTISGSFCKCDAAFRLAFNDCRSSKGSYNVVIASPFRRDSLVETFKAVSIKTTLFLFLYKTKPRSGSWETLSVGTRFDRLQMLPLDPVAPSLHTEKIFIGSSGRNGSIVNSITTGTVLHSGSTQEEAHACNGLLALSQVDCPVLEADKPSVIVPAFVRQHRSLSESCAYQIPVGSPRGILKNSLSWRRTMSESSDDFPYTLDSELSFPASSLDSIQPKKSVSFSDQISHITYRANSSILARRRRNQKKAANKKKAAARRALSRSDSTDTSGVSSGSEASLEDVSQICVRAAFKESTKAEQLVA
ncbi:uncharacterized protein LOC115310192 isoform X3 [Ixodes scapularis]|uniref:uncharacterized protein LOC115310192 isoform X3 n=1 Tax=Ixodes scapularis TaxID=6945 RepID=UPI001AD6EEE0|nr:uncharacterized protein LOC115310192 isoform X3 [Ixodes scapularis]